MNDDGVHREAAAWHARLNAPHVTNTDLEAFFLWRRDEANARAYDRLAAITEQMESLAGDPQIEAAAVAALRSRPRRGMSSLMRRAAWLGGAFALAAATALVIVMIPPRTVIYESDVGERRIVRLSDGSQLQLDTDSRARVRLGKQERRVFLDEGQAYFVVARDGRPFRVVADDVTVTALGTRFEVSKLRGRVGITLTEGRVEVKAVGKAGLTLHPGEEVLVDAASPPQPRKIDIEHAVSWTDDRLYFEDATLAEAVEEVNRYSSRKITLGAGAAPDVKINGAFDTGDIEAFAMAASELLPLRAEAGRNGEIVLLPRRLRAD